MTLETYLATAAATALAGTGTYLRESAVQAEVDTSLPHPAPFIIVGDYTTNTARGSSRTDSAVVTLYFADSRPGQGDSPEAHQAAVARMEVLKRAFLTRLDAYPLAQIEGIRATPFDGFYSAELDGIGVQLTLTVPAVVDCVDVIGIQ
jgi:hypothetical protein